MQYKYPNLEEIFAKATFIELKNKAPELFKTPDDDFNGEFWEDEDDDSAEAYEYLYRTGGNFLG